MINTNKRTEVILDVGCELDTLRARTAYSVMQEVHIRSIINERLMSISLMFAEVDLPLVATERPFRLPPELLSTIDRSLRRKLSVVHGTLGYQTISDISYTANSLHMELQ